MHKFIGLVGALGSLGCVDLDLHIQDKSAVQGSGNIVQEHRNVSGFSKIELQGAFAVDVKVGPSTSVDLKGDDNLLKLIETKVENGTLILSSNKKNLKSKKGIRITIATPKLNSFLLTGVGDVNIDGVSGNEFTAELQGVGHLWAKGKTDKLNATLKGVGNLNLYDLKAANVNAVLNGTGDMNVWASKYLKAQMTGIGDLSYKGRPETVDKQKSGIGTIHSKD